MQKGQNFDQIPSYNHNSNNFSGKCVESKSCLKKTYCSNIGYEFMHMGDPEEKSWIRDRIEGPEKNITRIEFARYSGWLSGSR